MSHLAEEFAKVGSGFRAFKDDVLYVFKLRQKTINVKYSNPSYKSDIKIKQVQKDFLKFIPFSIFILIPGLEVLLPAWLVIFPNAIPSQFLDQESRIKKFKMMTERRNKAAERLLYLLPKYLYQLEKDENIDETDKKQIIKLKSILRSDMALPTDLLQFRAIFAKYAKFNYFDIQTLQYIAHFMSANPATGLNIINNLLRFFKVEIPINYPIIRIFTQKILTRSLNLQFSKLRQQDEIIQFEKLQNLSEDVLNRICFERGIDIQNNTKIQQIRELKMWLAISNLKNVPHTLLLFTRIQDLTEQMVEITDDEDEFELLRKAQSEVYFVEKMRVFEKIFGIDELENMAKKVFLASQQNYIPQDGIYIFNQSDLVNYQQMLEEFKFRHSTLSDKIEQTYLIGNLIVDYLEKQIIIDYHFQGEQDIMEEEYPEIAEKAKRFLGIDFYYYLSNRTGEDLDKYDKGYQKLLLIRNELNTNFQDTMLKHIQVTKASK